MRIESELDLYEIAYLCGGRDRVAMVALVALHHDGQIKISADRHRVSAVRRAPRNPMEKTALEIIPEVGRVLGLTSLMIAASSSVEQVAQRLRTERLLPSSRLSVLWEWSRLKKARQLRRVLIESSKGLSRVAAVGVAGIKDDQLRRIFETHVYEPPKSVQVTGKKKPRTFDSINDYEAPDRSQEIYAAGLQMGIF